MQNMRVYSKAYNEKRKVIRDEITQLDSSYKTIFQKMRQYLYTLNINEYEEQDILLEILGICIESQAHDMEVEQVFPDSKNTCDELIKQSLKMSLKEKCIRSLLTVVGFVFFYFLTMIVFSYLLGDQSDDVMVKGYEIIVTPTSLSSGFASCIIVWVVQFVTGRFTYSNCKVVVYIGIIAVLIVILVTFKISYDKLVGDSVYTMPVFLFLGVSGCMTFLLYFIKERIARNTYYHH